MKEQLKKVEREKIIQENLGWWERTVYSDYFIDTIVEKSDSIKSPEDMHHFFYIPSKE